MARVWQDALSGSSGLTWETLHALGLDQVAQDLW